MQREVRSLSSLGSSRVSGLRSLLLNHFCVLALTTLLTGLVACGVEKDSNGGGGLTTTSLPASLSPQPTRYSFRADDDPVGFVPEVSSQVPNPPLASYNPDGTRVDCPASTTAPISYTYPGLTGPAATVNFVRKQLSGSGCTAAIEFP